MFYPSFLRQLNQMQATWGGNDDSTLSGAGGDGDVDDSTGR